MGFIMDNWGVVYFAAATACYFKPEWAICDSRLLTMIVIYIVLVVFKIFYRLALYPSFFTPLRHIQSPSVSWS